MGKKIEFSGKPRTARNPATADDWVKDRDTHDREPTKRFTIDVPVSLHKRVKTQCAVQNLVMADVMRELLRERFPERSDDRSVDTIRRGHDVSTAS